VKILISETQYNRLIDSEVTEGKHDDKDMKKLISWAEKKLGCTSHSIKNGIKLCPPEGITGFRCRTTHLTSKGVKPLQADLADWFGVSRRDIDTAFRLNKSIEAKEQKEVNLKEYFIPGLEINTKDVFLDLRNPEMKKYVTNQGGLDGYLQNLPDDINSLVIRGPYNDILNIDRNFYRFQNLTAMALIDLYVDFSDISTLCQLPNFFYLDLTGSEHTFVPECGRKMAKELYNLKLK
jgi:hypothetical protein